MEIVYGVLITLAVLIGIITIGFIVMIIVGLNAHYKAQADLEKSFETKRNKR
jgi:hypothetical protein